MGESKPNKNPLDKPKPKITNTKPKPVKIGLLRIMVASNNKANALKHHEIAWLVRLSFVNGAKIKIKSCTNSSHADGMLER